MGWLKNYLISHFICWGCTIFSLMNCEIISVWFCYCFCWSHRVQSKCFDIRNQSCSKTMNVLFSKYLNLGLCKFVFNSICISMTKIIIADHTKAVNNPCSAEGQILRDNNLNRMAADALAPCITRQSAAMMMIISLAPGGFFYYSLKLVNFKLISTINIFSFFCEIAIRWMPQPLTDH